MERRPQAYFEPTKEKYDIIVLMPIREDEAGYFYWELSRDEAYDLMESINQALLHSEGK